MTLHLWHRRFWTLPEQNPGPPSHDQKRSFIVILIDLAGVDFLNEVMEELHKLLLLGASPALPVWSEHAFGRFFVFNSGINNLFRRATRSCFLSLADNVGSLRTWITRSHALFTTSVSSPAFAGKSRVKPKSKTTHRYLP
jgi:hypothetical protein